MKGKRICFAWVSSNVGIPGNEATDKAANEALTSPVADLKIPWTDFKHNTTRYIKKL